MRQLHDVLSYDSAPYKDKFTLFHTQEDLDNSTNSGFLLGTGNQVTVRLDGEVLRPPSVIRAFPLELTISKSRR